MNKLEMVEALRNTLGIRKDEAQVAVQLFFDTMADTLIRGDRVEIRGLWSFYVKNYPGYIGRNPKTGEKIPIPPKKQPYFKPGKQLKKLVDN